MYNTIVMTLHAVLCVKCTCHHHTITFGENFKVASIMGVSCVAGMGMGISNSLPVIDT